MSEIDWSKAPEGTTHWDPVDRNHLKQEGQISFTWMIGKGWSEKGWQYPNDLSTMERLIVRIPWTGEGLPPVGTVCEWHGANSDGPDGWVYTDSKVIAYTEDNLFVVMRRDGCWPVVERVDNCGFRPIKTHEQIERDEFIEMVSTLLGWNSSLDGSRRDAGLLFDGGYRKPKPE